MSSPDPTPPEPSAPPAPTMTQFDATSLLQRDGQGWITARPVRLQEVVRRVIGVPQLLANHRDLITTSVKRDLGARFTGTVLGWVWPLIHPLFLFAAYYFIFTELLKFKLHYLPQGQKAALGVYMFVGIMAWAAIAEALMRGTNAIVENGNLIKKLAFPSEILPLNVALVGLVTLSFAMGVFIVVCLVTPVWAAPGPELLWIPVILLEQAVFTFGLVLLLSTLHVFFRDIGQVVAALSTVWMFATPLFWVPLAVVMPGIERWLPLIKANPIYHLAQAWRGSVMGELVLPAMERDGILYDPAVVTSPDMIPHHLLVFGLWALGLFLVGFTTFVLAQRRFADEV